MEDCPAKTALNQKTEIFLSPFIEGGTSTHEGFLLRGEKGREELKGTALKKKRCNSPLYTTARNAGDAEITTTGFVPSWFQNSGPEGARGEKMNNHR